MAGGLAGSEEQGREGNQPKESLPESLRGKQAWVSSCLLWVLDQAQVIRTA